MRPLRAAGGLAAVACAGLLLAGCSGHGAVSTSGSAAGFASVGAGVSVVADSHRKPVSLSGRTVAGTHLDVASMRGHVVVVNIWASWCAPCISETADLGAVARDTSGLGVRFVGVNVQDTDADAVAFAAKYHVPYPSLSDPDLSLAARLPSTTTPPSTLVLDRRGRMAVRLLGPTTAEVLERYVRQVAAEPVTSGQAGRAPG